MSKVPQETSVPALASELKVDCGRRVGKRDELKIRRCASKASDRKDDSAAPNNSYLNKVFEIVGLHENLGLLAESRCPRLLIGERCRLHGRWCEGSKARGGGEVQLRRAKRAGNQFDEILHEDIIRPSSP